MCRASPSHNQCRNDPLRGRSVARVGHIDWCVGPTRAKPSFVLAKLNTLALVGIDAVPVEVAIDNTPASMPKTGGVSTVASTDTTPESHS